MSLHEEWATALNAIREDINHEARSPVTFLTGGTRRGANGQATIYTRLAERNTGERFLVSMTGSERALSGAIRTMMNRQHIGAVTQAEPMGFGAGPGSIGAVTQAEPMGFGDMGFGSTMAQAEPRVFDVGDSLIGALVVGTPEGNIHISATADQKAIRAALEPDAVAGSWLSDIGKIARKIARGKILRRLAKAYQSVASNPWVARAVALVPGGDAAREATLAAARTIQRFNAGHHATRLAVAALGVAAREGNPAAQRTAQILATVNRGIQQVQQTGQVSGLADARDWMIRNYGVTNVHQHRYGERDAYRDGLAAIGCGC